MDPAGSEEQPVPPHDPTPAPQAPAQKARHASRWPAVAGAAAGGLVVVALLGWLGYEKLSDAKVSAPAVWVSEDEIADPVDVAAAAGPWTLAAPSDRPAASATPDALATLPALVAAHAAALDGPAVNRAMNLRGPTGKTPAKPGLAGQASGPSHHWEVQLAKKNTIETYAQQIDYFGIELGILMPGNKVTYVAGMRKPKPDVRTGPIEAENRYYFTWRRGDLAEADQRLITKAGLNAEGKVVVCLLPPEIESMLTDMEHTHAGARADRIERTRFAIRPRGKGFEFYVLEQTYW